MIQNLPPKWMTAEAVYRLSATFSGMLLRPDDDGYDQARAVWNGMIDRRPALIARCVSSADIRVVTLES